MKFDHSEFQFYQAKFHLRIEKIICWFYRVIKERNIYSRFFTWGNRLSLRPANTIIAGIKEAPY
jgi:hypothetical protein